MKRPTSRKSPGLADKADRHDLYEASVQDVVEETTFVASTFEHLRGRAPVGLREDFCGTASAACQWVRGDEQRFAIGVDFDAEVLDWGREHRLSRLAAAQRQRVKLINDDVLKVDTGPVDIVTAFNFSYWTFKTREQLRSYFAAARSALVEDGLMFLDIFGGSDAYVMGKEKTRHKHFTYVWDQHSFDPITADFVCHIHFRFPDGTRQKNAFTYEWRLWTIPEIRELLTEAGFTRVRVFWETEDDDGEGTGEYLEAAAGLNDPAWIAFIVAER
ncbi:MAG: class I SAM-dependent methyltransferase [Gammaproteobacteria bacterium]|nr:class I SAM-dependent methyltransferase [Gammaproteobacteria bacterium]